VNPIASTHSEACAMQHLPSFVWAATAALAGRKLHGPVCITATVLRAVT